MREFLDGSSHEWNGSTVEDKIAALRNYVAQEQQELGEGDAVQAILRLVREFQVAHADREDILEAVAESLALLLGAALVEQVSIENEA